MSKKHRIRFSIYAFLMYVEFFAIIYQSGTVAAALKTNALIFDATRFIMIFLGGVFLVLGLKKTTSKVKSALFFLFLITEFLAIINYILYPYSVIELQYKIVLFIIFYCISISCFRRRISIYEILYNSIFAITIVTLILYIAISLLKLPIPYTTIYAPGTSAVYYRNYFNVFYSYSISVIPRMCGIFWEPGVYQIYLNLGILLYILLNKKKNFQLLIFIISILFSQSSTGYMIMALLLGYMVLQSGWISKHFKLLATITISIFVVLVISIVIYEKKIATNQIGDSYYLRVLDIKNALSIFVEHPVFGVGFYNTDIFLKLNSMARGNSNGYLTWLYTTGLVGQVFALFPFVCRTLKAKSKYERNRIILKFIFIFLVNNSEPIYALPINVFFIAQEYYLFFSSKNKRINRNTKGGVMNVSWVRGSR